MSVCTKGFILTEFKNPFPVMGLVEKYLQLLMRPHWKSGGRAMAKAVEATKMAILSNPSFTSHRRAAGWCACLSPTKVNRAP